MTNEETKTEEISEVKKTEQSDPSALSIIANLVKAQEDRLDKQEETLTKGFDELRTLIKENNSNPVDSGIEAENKPKTEDKDDVGDKVTIGNEVAPKPSDSQASIIAPALESNTSDVEGLKMENKAEVKKDDAEEKKEEKKEEKTDSVEKMDDHDDKKDDKEEIKKSSDNTYEIIKTVRPKVYQPDEVSNIPTAYAMLKAAANGFGETTNAEEALTIMYRKYEAGEFGNGLPTFQGVY